MILNEYSIYFLNVYFEFSLYLNDYLSESEQNRLYQNIGHSFYLDDITLNKLYETINKKEVKMIKNVQEYLNYKTLNIHHNDFLDGIIKIKGETIVRLHQSSLNKDSLLTKEMFFQKLTQMQKQDHSIFAFKYYGFISYHGFLDNKNEQSGKKYLLKAAYWNDLDALFLSFSIANNQEKQIIMNKIYTITNETVLENLYKEFSLKTKCIATSKDNETKFIYHLIREELITQDTYNDFYYNLVYSKLISTSDKKKIIHYDKQFIDTFRNVPLSLTDDKLLIGNYTKQMLLNRPLEIEKLLFAIKENCDQNNESFYIVSDEEVIQEQYLKLLSNCFKNANVIIINNQIVTEMDVHDNFIIPQLSIDKVNIVIFRLDYDDEKYYVDFIKNFLDPNNRKKTFLTRHSIALNLSKVYPLCLGDSEMYKDFSNCCSSYKLEDFTEKEADSFIENYILDSCSKYHLSKNIYNFKNIKQLREFPLKDSCKLIDNYFFHIKYINNKVTLNDYILNYSSSINEGRLGF